MSSNQFDDIVSADSIAMLCTLAAGLLILPRFRGNEAIGTAFVI